MKKRLWVVLIVSVLSMLFFGCSEIEDDDTGDVTTGDGTTDYSAPTNIDLIGVSALATRSSSNITLSVSGSASLAVASTCDELGVVEDGNYTSLSDGSCITDVEFWDTAKIYGRYFIPVEVPADSNVLMATVSEPVSFITDGNGDVHVLPGHPIKKNSFSNSKVVESRGGKPIYINSNGRLVEFDFATDTEAILVDQQLSNFLIKTYSDGDHYFIDTTAGVKRVKPDLSETDFSAKMTPGNWHDMGDAIQYQSGSYFKRMRFDASGDEINTNCADVVACSSVPYTLQYWIDNAGELPDGTVGAAMPQNVMVSGSLPGCTNQSVAGQEIMICNGKAYRVKGDLEDLEAFYLCDYGHCGVTDFATVLGCAGSNYLYFYGGIDSNGNTRLTWINDLTGEYRDILDTHQLTDLECVSDSELYATGTIGDLTETLHITGADTVNTVVTVVDSQLTDVITP